MRPLTYDAKTAYEMSKFSTLVYEDWDVVKHELNSLGLYTHKFYDEGPTQAMLIDGGTFAAIILRGTKGLKDLLVDANLIRSADDLGRVHTGFKNYLDEIWEDVFKDIMGLSKTPLYIGGHSLGAGAATILSSRLWFRGIENDTYTYGSPRVGNRKFRHAYNTLAPYRHYRHVNNNDKVTDAPPEIIGYRHVGVLKYFFEHGRLGTDPSWWAMKKDEWHGMFDDIGELGFDSLKDHSASGYTNLTKRNYDAGALA